MIYVFYNNDPLNNDQGGGAEHFRGIHRALKRATLEYKLVAAQLNSSTKDTHIEYVSRTANFFFYFLGLWHWFFKNREKITESDVLHFHRNYAAWPKYILCRNKGKTIITYHNTTGKVVTARLPLLSPLIRSIMIVFEKMALNRADKIIFVSDRDRQVLRDRVIRNNYHKTLVIPAAFDSELFAEAKPPAKELHDKIVIIGRMSPQKNIQLAVNVFSNLKEKGFDFSLSIVGDGELKEEILSYIAGSKYKNDITFHGRVDHREVPRLISEHGIVLVTSRFEGSPTIVKEAIAAQRPVVTTDVGDVNVWIDNKECGFICEHDVESLTAGVMKASNLILNQRYRRTIDFQTFSEVGIMEQLLEVYKRV